MARKFNILKRRSPQTELEDREIAEQLLNGVINQGRIIAECGPLVRLTEQRKGSECEHVRGGLMTSSNQQLSGAHHLVLVELVSACQSAEEVIAWIGTPRPNEIANHGLYSVPRSSNHLTGRLTAEHGLYEASELLLIRGRDVQEVADHV